MRCWYLLVGLLLVSCKLTEEKWPEKSAKAQCKFAERCNTAQFYHHYADVDQCIDDTLVVWDEHAEFYEKDCIFQADLAKDCLKALDQGCKAAGRAYDELFEACFEVWDCNDELDTDALPIGSAAP